MAFLTRWGIDERLELETSDLQAVPETEDKQRIKQGRFAPGRAARLLTLVDN